MEKQVGSNSVMWLASPEVFKQTVHTYSQTLWNMSYCLNLLNCLNKSLSPLDKQLQLIKTSLKAEVISEWFHTTTIPDDLDGLSPTNSGQGQEMAGYEGGFEGYWSTFPSSKLRYNL